jgi:hypothetical protein
MPFGREILRGVRLAAILFAVFLFGLTVYRMVHITPVEEKQPPTPAAAGPSTPAANPAAKPPAKPVARSSGSDYPPPPPRSGASAPIHRGVRKDTAVATEGRPVVVGLSSDAFADARIERAAPEEVSAPAPEKEVAAVAASRDQDQVSDAPGTPDQAKPENRGKRWMKAVGRLFHKGGRKDAPEP